MLLRTTCTFRNFETVYRETQISSKFTDSVSVLLFLFQFVFNPSLHNMSHLAMFANTPREIFAVVVVVASYVEGKGVDLALLDERNSVRRSLFKADGARTCRSNNSSKH